MSCEVCMSEFTARARKPVQCRFCDYTLCADCTKTYLLTVADNPHCMSCSKGFTNDHILSMTNKTFVKGDFRKARLQNLIARERSLLESTFRANEREVARHKLEKRTTRMHLNMHACKRVMHDLPRFEVMLFDLYNEVSSLRADTDRFHARFGRSTSR